jgi:hypothetical protein
MAAAAVAAGLHDVSAQEDATGAPALNIELNALEPLDKGCRLTFVVTNRLGGELTKASVELALFDRTGFVDRLTVLDFTDMPQGKTKVSRFDIPGADCAGIGRILVNEVTGCAGPGLDLAACRKGLATSVRAEVEFGM